MKTEYFFIHTPVIIQFILLPKSLKHLCTLNFLYNNHVFIIQVHLIYYVLPGDGFQFFLKKEMLMYRYTTKKDMVIKNPASSKYEIYYNLSVLEEVTFNRLKRKQKQWQLRLILYIFVVTSGPQPFQITIA